MEKGRKGEVRIQEGRKIENTSQIALNILENIYCLFIYGEPDRTLCIVGWCRMVDLHDSQGHTLVPVAYHQVMMSLRDYHQWRETLR